MTNKLTPKQELFCKEYLKDLNARQAAVRAGYSEKTATVIGAENLTKPYIAEYIAKLKLERSERVQVDSDWVLEQAKKSFEVNAKLLYDEDGNAKMVNPTAAAKFLELTGKHVKVKAWEKEQEEKQSDSPITINFVEAKKPDAD